MPSINKSAYVLNELDTMQNPVLYQHAKDWDKIKEEYLLYNGDLFSKTSKSSRECTMFQDLSRELGL